MNTAWSIQSRLLEGGGALLRTAQAAGGVNLQPLARLLRGRASLDGLAGSAHGGYIYNLGKISH